MIIRQPMPPIHPDDKLYQVTLRPNSIIYPWNNFHKDWATLAPDTILPYRHMSTGGVPANDDKIDGKEYQLYLSRHAMVEFGMVLFYYRYKHSVLYRMTDGELTRISGWHALMMDVAQHEKV